MSRVFPELATLVKHLEAVSILELLEQYSTPQRIAAAPIESLKKIAYLRSETAHAIHEAAQQSVASLVGVFAERLVKELIRDIRQCQRNVIFPHEKSSGVDCKGRCIAPGTMTMSAKGCDLVRRYLWNAAKSAILHNPPVRELYLRLRARGMRGDVALGHCMRKLLHQVFAVWSTNRPFDPEYERSRPEPNERPSATTPRTSKEPTETGAVETETTAGHNRERVPHRTVVTAVASHLEPVNTPHAAQAAVEHSSNLTPAIHENAIDFSFVREQITFEQVLTHLGIRDQFRGRTQLRGPCPLCQSDSPRTLSVNLTKNIYRCFHPDCTHGNVLDFWATLQKQPLHTAVQNLAAAFGLQTRRNS